MLQCNMTAKTLVAKWRPRSWEDVIGQAAVIKTLRGSLTSGRLHHSYCFHGPRGTGKTTASRIFAKCLNCLGGITAAPCQCCASCLDIEKDRQIDFIEIDAATHRGLEEMVSVLEGCSGSPVLSRFKIVVIDEAHQLTSPAFCSMLKILEEPPAHAKFILCSTDLTKIPPTILSRSVNLHFHLVGTSELGKLVAAILRSEGLQFCSDVPAVIAKLADGSVRDVLTSLERIIPSSLGNLLIGSGITQSFGIPKGELVQQVIRSVASRDVRSVFALLGEAKRLSFQSESILSAVLTRLLGILSCQLNCSSGASPVGWEEAERELVTLLDCFNIRTASRTLLEGQRELRLSDGHPTVFGIILVRTILNCWTA